MEGRKTRFAENESEIFSAANLDDPNHLEMAAEIGFFAQHFCNVLDVPSAHWAEGFCRRAKK
jgi:hypothetical protein